MRSLSIIGVLTALSLALAGIARVEPAGGAVLQNITLPLSSIRSQDCTGELVQFGGELHLVALLENAGTVAGHLNYQGVTATGLTSGTIYRATSVDNFRIDLGGSSPQDVTSTRNIHLVGPGSGDNLLVQIVTHLTVNANGEVTASVEKALSVCV